MEIEEAVRRQSEAKISRGEGFEVVTRRRCKKMKLVVEEVGLCRSGSRKGQQAGGCWSPKAQGGEGQMASGFTVGQQEMP